MPSAADSRASARCIREVHPCDCLCFNGYCMIAIRKAGDRGITKTSWLASRHTFSFGEYRDPDHTSFGSLRVINADIIAGGGGFPPHSHADMEIVTFVLSGAMQHRDSLGTGSIIRPGEVQR